MTSSDNGAPQPWIEDPISAEEAHLAQLEIERAKSLARLRELRAILLPDSAAVDRRADQSSIPTAAHPRTPSEKVRLFRELFRGREDVFPTRLSRRGPDKPDMLRLAA